MSAECVYWKEDWLEIYKRTLLRKQEVWALETDKNPHIWINDQRARCICDRIY